MVHRIHLPAAAVYVEVDPAFMPQAHSRGSQRAERRRHREIEQQLEKVEKELWRLHRSPPLLLNALRLSDEALGHASETGDHHEGDAASRPNPCSRVRT